MTKTYTQLCAELVPLQAKADHQPTRDSTMDKIFDIFLGRLDGWHTSRVAQNVTATAVNEWLGKGYRIETEHQIGVRLHEVYLVKV